MANLAELLRQGADKLVNLPTEAQRFVTNPQAFIQLLTGKNALPRETGFAAGATGLPAQQSTVLDPNYQAYMQGYEQGEPVSYAAMATPAVMPVAKALAPKAGQMAENYMVNQGFMPSIVAYHGKPMTRRETLEKAFAGTMPHYKDHENLANVFENVGLKIKETGSSKSGSKYVEIYDPIGGEILTVRFADHPQTSSAVTLHGPAEIEIGEPFKIKSWKDAINPILDRINKTRKQYGDELLTINPK